MICKRSPGFIRVALADAVPERTWIRRGWVTHRRDVNIKEICWNLNAIKMGTFHGPLRMLLFLLITQILCVKMATTRHARIVLENHTGSYFKFQVLHQYTDESKDDSGWKEFAPGESKEMFAIVRYRTGFLTTGCDNWIVHGKQLVEVKGDGTTGIFDFNGKAFIEGLPYRSYHGFLAEWKKHTLRGEDDGKTTVIKVYQTTIDFVSPSGTSSTRFDTIADSAARIA